MAAASGLAAYLAAGRRLCQRIQAEGATAVLAGSRGAAGAGGGTGDEGPVGPLGVVVGNQACDADSIVSAITLGYLRSVVGAPGGGAAPARAFVSLLPIPRREFKLRRETVYLLDRFKVDAEQLVFADDIDLDAIHEPGLLRLHLTDHNQLSPAYKHLGEAVAEIVDHHEDQGLYPGVSGDARRVAFSATERRGIGSSCTLVAQSFLSDAQEALTEQVAALLLGVILIDTSNLSPKAKKATPDDESVVSVLKGRVGGVDATELFEALQAEKFNPEFWSTLSVTECLSYDYKQFTMPTTFAGAGGELTLGASSILMPLAGLYERDPGAMLDELARFAADRGLRLVLLLSFVVEPQLRREMLVFTPPGEEELCGAVLAKLMETNDLLQLVPISLTADEEATGRFRAPTTSGETATLAAFAGNPVASRKQVIPVMGDVLAKL